MKKSQNNQLSQSGYVFFASSQNDMHTIKGIIILALYKLYL